MKTLLKASAIATAIVFAVIFGATYAISQVPNPLDTETPVMLQPYTPPANNWLPTEKSVFHGN